MPRTVRASGQRSLIELDAADGLGGDPLELRVAGGGGEDQRVEEHLAPAQAGRLEAVEQPAGHLDLALRGARHAVGGVVVDAAGDDRGAEAPGQRGDAVEADAAVLEVDRVEHRPAGDELEGGGEDVGVGGVDHQGHAGGAPQRGDERGHAGVLVGLRVGEADVEHVGAAAHLAAADLRRLGEAPLADELLELARAEDVGALADEQRRAAPGRSRRPRRRPGGRGRRPGATRGAWASATARRRRMCSTVVPQQPPSRLIQPAAAKRARVRAISSGASR